MKEKEKGSNGGQKLKGFRSLTVMLILTICLMVFVPVVALVALGMFQISQSSEESLELRKVKSRYRERLR